MDQIDSNCNRRDRLFPKPSAWGLIHTCVATGVLSFFILALLPEARLADLSVPFGGENVRVARSLVVNGTFADPFATLKTGVTAHVAPVYPFIYSLFLRAFGTGYVALLVLWVLSLACLAGQMALLPLLSWRLRLGVLPGLLAAGLGSVSLFAPVDTHWENFFTGTLLLLFLLALEDSFSKDHSWWRAVGLGVCAGIIILTNPVAVLLVLAWPLCLLLARPRGERGGLFVRFAAIVVFALATVSPWVIRNYDRFGAFIFVRDNLGLELYTANNSCAAPTLAENIQTACHAKTHPNATRAVAEELAEAGEYAFNQRKLHEAFFWIESNRKAFVILSVRRFRQFWLPDLTSVWESISVWLITLLSLAGIFLVARKSPAGAALMLVAWAFHPLIYYVVQADPRYRYPIFWTSLLPAGCALAELALRIPFLQFRHAYTESRPNEGRTVEE